MSAEAMSHMRASAHLVEDCVVCQGEVIDVWAEDPKFPLGEILLGECQNRMVRPAEIAIAQRYRAFLSTSISSPKPIRVEIATVCCCHIPSCQTSVKEFVLWY